MNKYLSAAAISACLCTLAAAQSPVSPYSLFGIGSIDNSSHGAYTGMGGIGTGLRESNVLNTANPASLTAMKKQTFVLDLAARGGMSYLAGQGRGAFSGNGNLDHIGMGFRIGSFVSAAVNLTPLSNVEYRIRKETFIEGSGEKMTTVYGGSGGLHKIGLSLGFDVFRDLSAGITGSIIMGQITHTESSDYWTSRYKSVSNVTPYLNFGIQYHRQTGKYSSVTAGITGGYRKKFSMHNTTDISDNADSTVVSEKVSPSTVQNIPAFVGAGISYSTRTMTVGIDYSFQAYSSVNSGNALVEYKNMNRISAGISYTPNQYDVRHYWKRIQFLFGASVDDSYILTGKSEGLNWSVSAGMKFPFRNSNFLYWTLEYDRYGFPVTNRNTVSENCLSLTLGISFAEGWFIRRKFE